MKKSSKEGGTMKFQNNVTMMMRYTACVLSR